MGVIEKSVLSEGDLRGLFLRAVNRLVVLGNCGSLIMDEIFDLGDAGGGGCRGRA